MSAENYKFSESLANSFEAMAALRQGVLVIYDSTMFNLPRFGIGVPPCSQVGWLFVQNRSGEWMTLADLKPHFPPPPLAREQVEPAQVCAEYARRIAKLELELSQANARLAAVGFGAATHNQESVR